MNGILPESGASIPCVEAPAAECRQCALRYRPGLAITFHADGGEGIGAYFSLATEEEMEAGLARLAELFRRG